MNPDEHDYIKWALSLNILKTLSVAIMTEYHLLYERKPGHTRNRWHDETGITDHKIPFIEFCSGK